MRFIGFHAIPLEDTKNQEWGENTESLDLESFARRFGVKLYKFIPTRVYYLDNQIKFAFREEVIL